MTPPQLPYLTAADMTNQSKALAQTIGAATISAATMRQPLLSAACAVYTKPELMTLLHLNDVDCNRADHHWRHGNMSCSTNEEGDLYVVGERVVMVGIN